MSKRIEDMSDGELEREWQSLRADPVVRKVLKALMVRDERRARDNDDAHRHALEEAMRAEHEDGLS